jgi:hypothetical protein
MGAPVLTARDAATRQVPAPGGLVLDHVAHFLPDIDAASRDLARMGFALTPVSHQVHRTEPGGPLVSAGTANRTAMLARGYLEFLATTGDTPNAAKLRAAMARYPGTHLVCFGTAEADAVHARLVAAGFEPPPVVALQREVGMEDGSQATARFGVARASPERMPEGRIQFVEHRTPACIWQERWLSHPNGALSLEGVVVAVPDVAEAARRWASLSGRAVKPGDGGMMVLRTDRGRVLLGDADAVEARYGMRAPCLPWIAGPVIGVADMAAIEALLARAGIAALRRAPEGLAVAAPGSLGGLFVFGPASAS